MGGGSMGGGGSRWAADVPPQPAPLVPFQAAQERRAWFESFLDGVTLDKLGELRDIKKTASDDDVLHTIKKRWEKCDDLTSYGRLSWDQDSDVVAARKMDIQKIHALCLSNDLPWNFFGVLAALGQDDKTLEKALEGGADKRALLFHVLKNDGKNKNRIEMLLKKGATIDGWAFCRDVLPVISDDIVHLMMDHTLSFMYVRDTMCTAASNGKKDIFERCSTILTARVIAAPDNATLQVTKFLPDYFSGVASLKTVFDFHAKRVQEIYTPDIKKDGNTAMQSYEMEKYGREAAEEARLKLQEMTGKPVPEIGTIVRRQKKGLGDGQPQ